jgi:hypothetical protein
MACLERGFAWQYPAVCGTPSEPGFRWMASTKAGCGIPSVVLPTGPFCPMLVQVMETRRTPMAGIFISYATVDRPTARRLADALEACGWSVWWDHSQG